MSRVQWIKIATDIYKNEKVRLARDMAKNGIETMMVWIALLALAGKRNEDGRLMATETMPYTPKMLAGEFSFPLKLVEESLKIFEELNMVLKDEDNVYYIRDWEAHQNLKQLARDKEANRQYQANYRAKKKMEADEQTAPENNTKEKHETQENSLSKAENGDVIIDTPYLSIRKMPKVEFEAEEEEWL